MSDHRALRRARAAGFVPTVVSLATLTVSGCGPGSTLPLVKPNDNRVGAGEMRGDTLVLGLVVENARWYPEGEGGPHADVAAIAVEGGPPSIPAPMIRVPTGTILDITVRNALADSTVWMHGFVPRPAEADSASIAPGVSRQFTFEAGAPGTYMYLARPGFVDNEDFEREQLIGAFVVDGPGEPTDDRVFVMNIWSDPLLNSDGEIERVRYRNALTVNGLAYPFGETIATIVGDRQRWRVVNATARQHPMHLHGFYFDVTALGGVWQTAPQEPGAKHVVTEDMFPFQTMDIEWTPSRGGNWLFHCHIVFHVAPAAARLRPQGFDGEVQGAQFGDVSAHMSGLAWAIEVAPTPGGEASTEPEASRQVRLFVQEAEARGQAPRSMGYVLQEGDEPATDSIEIPGTPLVLTRGETTEVLVVNRLTDPTGVHWHGLEVESYSDGVAGFSGIGDRVAPLIAPGESFTAELRLEKAGTFIYHTHFDDIEQLTSGLYAPIIVLEPDEVYDPARDHTVTAAWDGAVVGEPFKLVVDGEFDDPEPLNVQAGVEQRFRFINIAPAARFFFSLERDAELVPVRLVAKDGADLPTGVRRNVEGPVRLTVGETADILVTLDPGEYELVVENPIAAPRGFVRRVIAR